MGELERPQSKLTYERPDIWNRALALATNLTGYSYPPKMPLADGTLSACGGGYYAPPLPRPKPPQEKIKELEDRVKYYEEWLKRGGRSNSGWDRSDELRDDITSIKERIEKIKQENPIGFNCQVYVPEGAMEWLLHEVGHWVAATPEERLMPDYGYGFIKEKGWGRTREWQAWGFEDIILSPLGITRLMAAPEHRGGVAFSQSGAIPDFATAHADRQIKQLSITIGEWRELYGEWVIWSRVRAGEKADG